MKIFPLVVMSNYDKAKNLIKIMANPKSVYQIPSKSDSFVAKNNADSLNCVNGDLFKSCLLKIKNMFK